MKLKIKFFVVFAFLAFAACAFLFSNNKSQAQTSKNDKDRDEILQKVANYKNWKELVKPEAEPEKPSIILNSTAMG